MKFRIVSRDVMRMAMDEPKETVTAKHVAVAIHNCSNLNNSGSYWATLEFVPSVHGQIVHMDVGNIRKDGTRERKNQTLTYALDSSGEVHVSKHTHP